MSSSSISYAFGNELIPQEQKKWARKMIGIAKHCLLKFSETAQLLYTNSRTNANTTA